MNTWLKAGTIVKGVSFFDGVIDGKEIRSAVIYIEEQMDEKSGREKGFRTVAYKSTPDVVKRIIHLEFPITAEVAFVMKVTKNNNEVAVEDVKPTGRAMPQPQQKAA